MYFDVANATERPSWLNAGHPFVVIPGQGDQTLPAFDIDDGIVRGVILPVLRNCCSLVREAVQIDRKGIHLGAQVAYVAAAERRVVAGDEPSAGALEMRARAVRRPEICGARNVTFCGEMPKMAERSRAAIASILKR